MSIATETTVLSEEQWRARQAAHAARVEPWVAPRQERTRTGAKHPTDDFLFEYYPYSVSRLRTWHPGYGVVLHGDAGEFLRFPQYEQTTEGVTASLARATFHRERLGVALRILRGTSSRAPMTGCFALHEWAMVYGLQPDEVRHSAFPLRLGPSEIRDTVDEIGLRCTHIDAYRFFTPEAAPMNMLVPTRGTQPDLEQPGCLHATMDLYKYCQWFHPYVPMELTADCFSLARQARELDMRASPYDMTQFGLEPILVEEPDGRRAYAAEQQRLVATTAPIRQRVLVALSRLADAAGSH